jgi:ubiquinone/menaquinone biosynthesis C-methylase UbiE
VTAREDTWGAAAYERVAEEFAPIHDRVVAAVAPQPGERVLDVGCGTGGVALRAVRAGAEVTGLDLSAAQLDKARAAAEDEGLDIRFDEGDCQEMPYEDGSFDVVVSVFGAIFAESHARAAAELARVCSAGGRLALTAWPYDGWSIVGDLVGRELPAGDDSTQWVRQTYARRLLGDAFALRFEWGQWELRRASAQEVWEFATQSVPPLRGWLDEQDEAHREQVAEHYRNLFSGGLFRREYFIVLGQRM